MKTAYIVIIILLFVFGVAFGLNYFVKDGGQVACTEDARICPDGSGVGRVPPDCEFAPCPNKECSINSDCVVFGEDGDCNCGCYNKDFLPQNTGGACFCVAPSSCECVVGECEMVFGDVGDGDSNIINNACLEIGCGAQDVFAGSKNSDKYYGCECGWAKTINSENLVCFADDDEAILEGRVKSEC